jgi:hypothetical protein
MPDSNICPSFQTVEYDGNPIRAARIAKNIENQTWFWRSSQEDNQIKMLAFKEGKYIVHDKKGNKKIFEIENLGSPIPIKGVWSVEFNEKTGAPANIAFPELISWTTHPNPFIKHYSGKAVYRKQFNVPDLNKNKNTRIYMDLGDLSAMAEVFINSESAGILWKPPYRLDVTQYLKTGTNKLAIVVLNTWYNRFLLDLTLPKQERFLEVKGQIHYINGQPYYRSRLLKDLMPSGLFGPVRLVFGQCVFQ